MDYSVLHEFVNHPGFELYNMIINAQIEDFRAKLEGLHLINPYTKGPYTETEYEVMRWMINNLREIQNAPLEELQKQIYELEIPEQQIIEKEIELTKMKMEKQKELDRQKRKRKWGTKDKVCKVKHRQSKKT